MAKRHDQTPIFFDLKATPRDLQRPDVRCPTTDPLRIRSCLRLRLAHEPMHLLP